MFKEFLEGQQARSFKSDAKIIGFAVRCIFFFFLEKIYQFRNLLNANQIRLVGVLENIATLTSHYGLDPQNNISECSNST